MSKDCLEKWKIFESLSEQVKRSISLAIVYRRYEEVHALYVTKDDSVYSLRKVASDASRPFEPEKIQELCGQKITDVAYSLQHEPSIYAISSASGSVFAWGANEYCQLGLGSDQPTTVPTKITANLEQKRVVRVACGFFHALALTSDGQVFAFGSNYFGELGLGDHEDRSVPTKVEGPLAGRCVTAIACQGYASLAVLDSGEVFAWGFNKNNILGLTSPACESPNVPCRVSGLQGASICRVACGSYHTLALSSDAKIFAWGDNKFGQLGNGSTDISSLPTLISTTLGRVKDIAVSCASDDHSPCVALTEQNQVYMWGRCYGQNILRPTITSFSSVDDVFATVVYPAATVRPLRAQQDSASEGKNDSLLDCLKRLFNDPESADFVFVVAGRKIHVHKFILRMRCAIFKTMFQGNWKENHVSEKAVEGHSYDAFFAFLRYLYTDELDVPPNQALEILELAHFYQLNGLQNACEESVKSGLTTENAATIFEKALLFGAMDLQAFTLDFCSKNLAAVLRSDSFASLSDQARSDFMRRVAKPDGLQRSRFSSLDSAVAP